MKKEIFQVPGEIKKIETMSAGIKLRVDVIDNISPDEMLRLMNNLNKEGWFTFNVHQIEAEDIVGLPPLKQNNPKKTLSQRLRDVLFRNWEQDSLKLDFDSYYEYAMEQLINHYKGKLS